MIYWMGSEAAWDVVVHAQQQVEEGQKTAGWVDEMLARLPPLWDKQGSMATVKIQGSLVNGSAGIMRLFGVVGYDDLLEAAAEASSDPDVKSVMYHIDSGGGHVAGLAEFGRQLGVLSSAKNSAVYTNTKIGSAAYWTATAINGPIMMDATAEVGSIGVLQVHTERSKQLAAAGITSTIIRSGEQKARVNPIEPLTEDAKAHLQSQLDDLHDMFRAQVKKGRPGMSASQLKEATDGRTFLGKRAVEIGLADTLASAGQALKLLDKNLSAKHTSRNSKGAAMQISPKQLAQLAHSTGKSLDALGMEMTDDIRAEAELEMTRLQAEQVAADAQKKADAEAAAAKAADAEKAKKGAMEEGTGLASLFEAKVLELATAKAELATAKAELITAQATATTLTEQNTALASFVRDDFSRMAIAMGGSAVADTVAAATLLTDYPTTKASFLEKFPVGGRSRSGVDVKPGTKDVPPAFRALAHLNAQK